MNQRIVAHGLLSGVAAVLFAVSTASSASAAVDPPKVGNPTVTVRQVAVVVPQVDPRARDTVIRSLTPSTAQEGNAPGLEPIHNHND